MISSWLQRQICFLIYVFLCLLSPNEKHIRHIQAGRINELVVGILAIITSSGGRML